jgi:hypothetical protein
MAWVCCYDCVSICAQHVVFLLGQPLTNRSVIAKRLSNNRWLRRANGIAPVVLEFDDCIPEATKARLTNGESLVRVELLHVCFRLVSDAICCIRHARRRTKSR